MEKTFKELCNDLRAQILTVETDVGALKTIAASIPLDTNPPLANRAEMIANTQLAFRHLEDARMRLGKAIQAFDGGVSVYDKKA